MEIPRDRYDALLREIASDESPVGIDAARTHVMILHALDELARRLERIEARLDAAGGGPPGASSGVDTESAPPS